MGGEGSTSQLATCGRSTGQRSQSAMPVYNLPIANYIPVFTEPLSVIVLVVIRNVYGDGQYMYDSVYTCSATHPPIQNGCLYTEKVPIYLINAPEQTQLSKILCMYSKHRYWTNITSFPISPFYTLAHSRVFFKLIHRMFSRKFCFL